MESAALRGVLMHCLVVQLQRFIDSTQQAQVRELCRTSDAHHTGLPLSLPVAESEARVGTAWRLVGLDPVLCNTRSPICSSCPQPALPASRKQAKPSMKNRRISQVQPCSGWMFYLPHDSSYGLSLSSQHSITNKYERFSRRLIHVGHDHWDYKTQITFFNLILD